MRPTPRIRSSCVERPRSTRFRRAGASTFGRDSGGRTNSAPSGRLRVDRLALLHVEEEQPDADADGRVGHVERGPVVGLAAPVHVDVEEIDDVAEAEAVDEVADGAAEDQVEAHLQRAVGHRGTERVDHHHHEHRQRADVQQRRHEVRLRVRADAEGGAAVAHVHELEEVRHERHGVVEADARGDEPLRGAVGDEDQERYGQELESVQTKAPRRSSISLSSSVRKRPRISSYVKWPSVSGPRLRFTYVGAHHMPRSASSVSPGPFTRHPMIAMVMSCSFAYAVISRTFWARSMKASFSTREHDGQLMMFSPFCSKRGTERKRPCSMSSRICRPTVTSSPLRSNGRVRETRMVSPMPRVM